MRFTFILLVFLSVQIKAQDKLVLSPSIRTNLCFEDVFFQSYGPSGKLHRTNCLVIPSIFLNLHKGDNAFFFEYSRFIELRSRANNYPGFHSDVDFFRDYWAVGYNRKLSILKRNCEFGLGFFTKRELHRFSDGVFAYDPLYDFGYSIRITTQFHNIDFGLNLNGQVVPNLSIPRACNALFFGYKLKKKERSNENRFKLFLGPSFFPITQRLSNERQNIVGSSLTAGINYEVDRFISMEFRRSIYLSMGVPGMHNINDQRRLTEFGVLYQIHDDVFTPGFAFYYSGEYEHSTYSSETKEKNDIGNYRNIVNNRKYLSPSVFVRYKSIRFELKGGILINQPVNVWNFDQLNTSILFLF